ncbi:hypothetical protein D6774_03285 [Candidatus Woesearchaeota archaeon]|nr:MAG: hypothetical protein D6774_03285 [Candidatus Woesearchaeota archaeon]
MAFPFFKKKKEDFSDLSALGLDENDFKDPAPTGSKFQNEPLSAPTPSFQENPLPQDQTSDIDTPYSFDQPLPTNQTPSPNQPGLDLPQQNPGQQSPPQAFTQLSQSQPQPSNQPQLSFDNKDFEIINAKLDSIRAMLDNLNQRISNLEQLAQGNNSRYKW